jgi:hypothetical protein
MFRFAVTRGIFDASPFVALGHFNIRAMPKLDSALQHRRRIKAQPQLKQCSSAEDCLAQEKWLLLVEGSNLAAQGHAIKQQGHGFLSVRIFAPRNHKYKSSPASSPAWERH